VRRCLVLHLKLPRDDDELLAHLVARGAAHFPSAPPELLTKAAQQLIEDRRKADREQWRPLPGQAEYLDLLRAVLALAEPEQQLDWIERIGRYVLAKHPDAPQ
jgi:hypothetical protein